MGDFTDEDIEALEKLVSATARAKSKIRSMAWADPKKNERGWGKDNPYQTDYVAWLIYALDHRNLSKEERESGRPVRLVDELLHGASEIPALSASAVSYLQGDSHKPEESSAPSVDWTPGDFQRLLSSLARPSFGSGMRVPRARQAGHYRKRPPTP